jgi:hypothetical protein
LFGLDFVLHVRFLDFLNALLSSPYRETPKKRNKKISTRGGGGEIFVIAGGGSFHTERRLTNAINKVNRKQSQKMFPGELFGNVVAGANVSPNGGLKTAPSPPQKQSSNKQQGARKKNPRKQAEGENFVFSQKTEGGPSRFLRKQREAGRPIASWVRFGQAIAIWVAVLKKWSASPQKDV